MKIVIVQLNLFVSNEIQFNVLYNYVVHIFNHKSKKKKLRSVNGQKKVRIRLNHLYRSLSIVEDQQFMYCFIVIAV